MLAKRKNLGMVKMLKIGQSACLLPNDNSQSMEGRQRLNGYGSVMMVLTT